MYKNRVIPVLLNDGFGLVKTINFKNPTYIGDPLNAIRIFNQKYVDEIILLDISKSIAGHEPNFELAQRVASECFMPFAYGGGITTLDHASRLFQIGIEKLVIQKAFFISPNLVSSIANMAGSQSVCVSVDVAESKDGYRVFHTNGRVEVKRNLAVVLKQIQEMGAGEIMLTNISREGKYTGLDHTLIELAKDAVTIPIIINGGAKSYRDLLDAFPKGADAAAAGSLFVFYGNKKGVLLNYPTEIIEKEY